MEFNWTTFVLEIINFVVLVWILQRFLYKPVTATIAKRKAGIEKTLADAKTVQAEAQSLKQQYANRMDDWTHEKDLARGQLLEEINAERTRLMTALRLTLEQEREKLRGLEQRQALELQHTLEEAALTRGGQFVARLLSRVASPELEAKICEMLLQDLPQLADKDLQPLRVAWRKGDAPINVISASSLGDEQRSRLVQALSGVAGQPVACDFGIDPDLMAGLRISSGPWMLRSNLRDELKFFTETHRGS